MYSRSLKRAFSFILAAAVLFSMLGMSLEADAASGMSITYSFSGKNASDAGYAEGTITLSGGSSGTYKLYWADDSKALDGYYSIASLKLDSGGSQSVKMGCHTAIPAHATKIIATKSSKNVSEAEAVYSIPENKQLESASGELLYSFNSYSDVHIDKRGYYKKSNERLADAFAFGVEKKTDFIVSSGDMVTNANGPDEEWKTYEKILSESGYVNPVWESDGNHDMRCGVQSGLASFIRATGTDSTKANYDKDKPYYYMFEEKTGDLFIFMALENGSSAGTNDEFSDEQMAWVTELLEKYYNTGINIFLVEHAPIKGFGAGDNMKDPYYGGLLREKFASTVKFKNLLIKYKNIVFMSGHTHEDFAMGYNYSNENDSACHMIHNPAVTGSTMPDSEKHKLNYNNGEGFNSQGYYVEAYKNRIIFYGANLTDKKIYPQYCYIMEGSRSKAELNPVPGDKEPIGVETSLTDKLSEASGVLSSYYSYSSYDQYQALKKLYYRYKNTTSADKSVAEEFDEKIAALKDIADHTGMPTQYTVGKKYYFENTKAWTTVYAYAWTGKTHNKDWPGEQISVSQTADGKDIYAVEFDTAGQYENLIFSNGKDQTVDISLAQYKHNAFRLGSKNSKGKYTVENFDVESGTVSETSTYALLYYVKDEHAWDDKNTLLTQDSDGKYHCSYTAGKSCNISLSLYEKAKGVYKSLAESQKFEYSEGTTNEYTLKNQSSRGSSITVKNLEKDDSVYITYDPSTEGISVSCGAPKAEPNGSLTVCDGTETINNIPYRGVSNNESTGTQQIYPAAMLTDMKDKDIWSMTLYSADETVIDIKGLQLYFAEVSNMSLAEGWASIPADAVKMFDGDYDLEGSSSTITFKKPFRYKGGDLLVVIQNTEPGSNNFDKEFYGVTTENPGASCCRYSSSNTAATSSFLSKCTFAFVDDNLYTVTWKNDDGTVLETDAELPYGAIPSYDGAAPEKQPDEQNTYTFSGWSPEITAVKGDTVYTAVYESNSISDTDTATDSDTASDTDTATGSDTASDTDTATDSDVPSDTDTATDSDVPSDTDTEADSDVPSDTDTETDSDIASDTDIATDSDIASDTDTETDSDVPSDTDTETDSDIPSDTDTATDSDKSSDTDSESEPKGLLGDADGDGNITAADALAILRCSIGLESFDNDRFLLSDIDKDKSITANDALAVLRFSVGLAGTDTPINKPVRV